MIENYVKKFWKTNDVEMTIGDINDYLEKDIMTRHIDFMDFYLDFMDEIKSYFVDFGLDYSNYSEIEQSQMVFSYISQKYLHELLSY